MSVNMLTFKRVPSPEGRKGGPAHQDVINKLAAWLAAQGLTVATEVAVKDAAGKVIRFIDVVGSRGGQAVVGFQVGLMNQNMTPVAREARALADILANLQYNPRLVEMGLKFVPYGSR